MQQTDVPGTVCPVACRCCQVQSDEYIFLQRNGVFTTFGFVYLGAFQYYLVRLMALGKGSAVA